MITDRKLQYVYDAIINSRKKYGELKKCEFHIHTPSSSDYKLDKGGQEFLFTELDEIDVIRIAEEEGLINHQLRDEIISNIDTFRSSDYKTELELQNAPFESFKEYVVFKLIAHKLFTSNIEVAVISDHNTISGYKKLKYALNEYYLERCVESKATVTLFLGVEISCSERNHVIAIFDDGKYDCLLKFLEDILISDEEGTYETCYQILDKINDLGGIGYLAHINSSELLGSGGYNKTLFGLKHFNILGITDIAQKDGVINRIRKHNSEADKKFCFILEGDTHNPNSIGQKNAWIKFSKVNFTSLQKAFLDHSICVYNQEPVKSDKFIKGLVASPGDFGFLRRTPHTNGEQLHPQDKEDFVIDFSQDLNCIIGGRGTGKSTILNIIETMLTNVSHDDEILKFISRYNFIYLVFHYLDSDYILRFCPQVNNIIDKSTTVEFLEKAFTKVEYSGTKCLSDDWVKVFKVTDKGFEELNNKDTTKILKGIYRRAYSINKLVSKIESGDIGEFIRNTVMYGINYQGTYQFKNKLRTMAQNRVDVYLRNNLSKMLIAFESQSELVNNTIKEFNEKYDKQIQVVYSHRKKDAEYYLGKLLKFTGKGNVASTFLKWNEAEFFVKRASEIMGYLNFLDCLYNKKYSKIEEYINIKDFIDRDRISISDIDKGLDDITESNKAQVYQEILRFIKKDKHELINSISRWFQVNDDFTLRFNVNFKESVQKSAPTFKELINLSLGQKVVAILTFVFNFGAYVGDNTPLIIDQPEDNLDNQYIYRNLVESLKNIKNKRQVIVVTHSSTIVTNADAEQVIVMESDNENGWLLKAGYPSDSVIIKHILNYLEGGVSSFKNKFEKYRLSIPDLTQNA